MSEHPTEAIPTHPPEAIPTHPPEAIPTQWTSSIVPGLGSPPQPQVEAPPGGPVPPLFDVVLRGYERRQVDAHLAGLAQRVEQLRGDLELARSRELAALQEASRARTELERGRPTFEALGERVTQLLGLAEAEAASLRESALTAAAVEREEASKAAATLRSDAQRDAERILASSQAELADLQQRRTRLLVDLRSVRDTLDGVLADRQRAHHEEDPDVQVDLREPAVDPAGTS